MIVLLHLRLVAWAEVLDCFVLLWENYDFRRFRRFPGGQLGSGTAVSGTLGRQVAFGIAVLAALRRFGDVEMAFEGSLRVGLARRPCAPALRENSF